MREPAADLRYVQRVVLMRTTSFRRAATAIAVLATIIALTACNARFHADFEQDSTGAPPALNPPGPADDEIVIVTSEADGEGIVVRVTDEPGLVAAGRPHRFMSLVHEANPGSSSIASLRSEPMTTGTQSIFMRWEQVLDGGGTGTITLFALPDHNQSDVDLCLVTTGNDVITLSCGSSREQIASIDTHTVHTVLLRIDRSPRRAVLQVVQEGSPTPLVTIESDEVPAAIEGQRVVAQIEYLGQSSSAYRFNWFAVEEWDPN
jgi:hypothetical protein